MEFHRRKFTNEERASLKRKEFSKRKGNFKEGGRRRWEEQLKEWNVSRERRGWEGEGSREGQFQRGSEEGGEGGGGARGGGGEKGERA